METMGGQSSRKRIIRHGAWYGPMALLLLTLVGILLVSLLFRVAEVEVINASEYSEEEIIRSSGIEEGANLLFVDRFKAASMIFSDLPYMDTVSIRRQIPNKIIIQAEGTAPVAYLRVYDEYWLLSRNGKMLGVVSAAEAETYPEIRNLEPITAIAGEDMMVEGVNEERLAYMAELLNAFQAEGMLERIAWLDMKNAADPTARLDGRLTVHLGPREDTPLLAALLRDVVDKLGDDDTGLLFYSGGSAWTYSPD